MKLVDFDERYESCSLLVPCYNGEGVLPRLLKSVHDQEVPFDEVLVYDDASSDASAAVAERFGVRVTRGTENRGPSFARNRLAEAASGTWLYFCDADDELHPAFCRQARMRMSGEADVVACSVDWRDARSGNVVIARRYDEQALRQEAVAAVLRNPIGGINGILRRHIFESIGGFDESLRCWEDADLYLRAAASGARFATLAPVLLTSWRSGSGVSEDVRFCWQARLALLQRYACELNPQYQEVIAHELELAAGQLLGAGAWRSCAKALKAARALGFDLPVTQHRVLRISKSFLPSFLAFGIQWMARNRSAKGARYRI